MFSWHAIPFARLLVPFILGIFISLYLPLGIAIPFCGLFLLITLYLVFLWNRNSVILFRSQLIIGIVITLLMLILGYTRTYFHNELKQPNHFTTISKSKYLKLVVEDGIIEKSKFFRCYARVVGVVDSSKKLQTTQGSLLFYLRKGGGVEKPQIGNQYWVASKYMDIQSPLNPEEFNYREYLSYHNIHQQLFSDSVSCLKQTISTASVYQYASIWRDKSLDIIKTYIKGDKEAGVAEALLMGYKDDLDPDITAAFMRTGTLHVLAVSGMHAGIIYVILAFLTAPLKRRSWGQIIQVLILLLGIWLYAFMTGLSSSVLRASVMFSFITVGKLLRYQVNIYNNIYSSAFLLLVYNPRYIVDVGFQLSYLAVLGIVFIQPIIQKWYQPKFLISKYIWSLVSVSLAAQLLTFPIGIFYFHQFPNYFILSNLLIIPITSLILIGLIILMVASFIPTLAYLLGSLILYVVQFNNWLVLRIDQLPYSYINGLHLNLAQMFLLYLILLLVFVFWISKNKVLLNPVLVALLLFFSTILFQCFEQSKQRIIVVHQIKGHDVYSCIDGKTVYLLSDSNFLSNEASIKFFLEPFYWKQGIVKIKKCDLKKSFVSTNIIYDKNVGFQFFDKFLTIDKILKKNVQNNGILIIKNPKKGIFKNLNERPMYLKYGANTRFLIKRKIANDYFERFGTLLKDSKSFILISF